MDKISVIFLANIACLIISLKVNILETFKETPAYFWSFLTKQRRLLLFKSNIFVLFVVGCAVAVIVYNFNTFSVDLDLFLHEKQRGESARIAQALST